MMNLATYLAVTRFGMGIKPDEAALVAQDPAGWLDKQILRPETPPAAFSGLPDAATNLARLLDARGQGDKAVVKDVRHDLKDVFKAELLAKLAQAVATPAPFYERLVDFWSNHFTVSIRKGGDVGLAGAFEREAIRPHVTGRFEDLLLAVVRHPAMLVYLDNAQSIGPHSRAGERTGKGLNENLAREIMELHTLGVGAGYSQNDVTSFAKVLTGWSVGTLQKGEPGKFHFFPFRHEPGPQTVFGTEYPQEDEAQGVAVLQRLATHPATARHLAFKLARHFIADTPPEAAVARLAGSFLHSGGDLTAVMHTLLALPESWQTPSPKLKTSYDLVVSALRLCGAEGDAPLHWGLQSLRFLGDVPFTATSPAGFSDLRADIMGPEAVMRRIEWAQGAGQRLNAETPVMILADASIGPVTADTTRAVLASAKSPAEGLSLLLGSPEFQRR